MSPRVRAAAFCVLFVSAFQAAALPTFWAMGQHGIQTLACSAPVVTVHPAPQTLCSGQTATFTANATGFSVVQWQVSIDGGTNFTDILGATSTTYSFPVATSDSMKQYRAVFDPSCPATTNAATLIVNTTPVVTVVPTAQNVCLGTAATYTADSSDPSDTVQWQVLLKGASVWNTIGGATNRTLTFTPAAVDAGNAYRAVFTNGCGFTRSAYATLQVRTPPTVTAQPGNQTVCAGAVATFTAGVSGTTGTVRWQVSTDGGANFSNIPGAAAGGATYSFTATAADNNKQYRALMSNSCASSTTTPATLTVTPGPVVTTHPNSQSVCPGNPVSFTAAASAAGAPQWQVSIDGGANYSDIPGETNGTYTFTAGAGDNGNRYRARFVGCTVTVFTNAAILSTASPAITANPANTTACEGSMANFSASAVGASSTQWQVSSDGINFSDIPGAIGPTYGVVVTAADNGKQYRANFTNACGTQSSAPATLTVTETPVVSTQPAAQNICEGQQATFTSTATAGTVQWQVLPRGSGIYQNIPGATNTTYTFTPVANDYGNAYRAVFTNSCGVAKSNNGSLQVRTAPVTSQPSSQTVCEGSPASFTVTVSGSPAPSIRWQVSTDGTSWTNIVGGTAATYAFTATAADHGKQYRVVLTNSCAVTTSNPATLSVTATPVVTDQPDSQAVCPGGTATFESHATNASSFQWQVSTDGGANYTDVNGATTETLQFVTQASDDGNRYRLRFTSACAINTFSAPAALSSATPVITSQPANSTVCAGTSASFTAAITGFASVQWQVSSDGINFVNIGGATSPAYAFTATTADNAKQYRAIFTNSCGAMPTSAATLTVKTAPVVVSPTAQNVCEGNSATFTASSHDPAASVYWEVLPKNGSVWNTIPGATSPIYSFTPTPGQAGNAYRAVFTNACGTTKTALATLQVRTAPVVTLHPTNVATCPNSLVSFTTAMSGTAGTVRWQVSTDGINFTNIPGAAGAATTYSLTATVADNGKAYRAVFTNSCSTATTSAATLTVGGAPTVATQPASQAVCAVGSVTFTAAGAGTPTPTLQWYSSPDGTNWTVLGGATSNDLVIDAATATTGTLYRATITNSCGSVNTNVATLTIHPLPDATITAPTDVTSGQSYNASVPDAGAGATYAWIIGNGTINGATNTSSINFTAGGAGAVTLDVDVTSGNGCLSQGSASLTATDAPGSIAIDVSSDPVCANSSLNSANVTPRPNMTYSWTIANGAITNGAATNAITFTAGASGSVTLTVRETNSVGDFIDSQRIIPIEEAPGVTINPSDAAACANDMVGFTVGYSGTNVTIQWEVSTDGGANWTNAAGPTATGPLYSFPAQQSDNGNRYRAVLTNSCGTATSAAATLSITTGPAVTLQPVNDTVCEGETAEFTAAASGTNPTVQWQFSTDGVNWTNVGGATSTTFSGIASASLNGNQVRAVFTNSCGTATTNAATLTVNTAPAVNVNPTAQAICENTQVTFSAAATGTPTPTVQWQVSSDGVSYTDISGATALDYTFTATTADNNKRYRARFTNSCGADVATTAATLTVNVPPSVTTNPSNAMAVAGANATFTAAASATPAATVQWEVSADGGSNWTDIPGATSTTYMFSTVYADNTKQYRARFTNTCGLIVTTAATLTVTCPVFTWSSLALPNATYNVANYTTNITVGNTGNNPITVALALANATTVPVSFTFTDNGNGTATIASSDPNVTGAFTFQVTATSSVGCAETRTFTLNVLPHVVNDSFSNAVGNTQSMSAAYTPAPTTPRVSYSGTLLDNDESAHPMTVGATGSCTSGAIVYTTSGNWLYTPATTTAGSPTCTYTVTSNGVSNSGTVSVGHVNKVWYVKNNAGAGLGQSQSPFNSLANAGSASAAGDIIFVYAGDGTSTNQNAGIVLKDNQVLQGETFGLTVNGHALVGAGPTRPTIGNSGGAVITVANTNAIRGFNVTATSTAGISLNNVTGVTSVDQLYVTASGAAHGLSISGTTSGALTWTTGSLTIAAGAATGSAINITGGSGNITLTTVPISVTGGTGARAFNVSSRTGGALSLDAASTVSVGTSGSRQSTTSINFSSTAGTVTFSGPVTVFTNNTGTAGAINIQSGTASYTFSDDVTVNATIGRGVLISSNSGTHTFSDVVNVTSTNQAALEAVNAGTLIMTSTSSVLSATTGKALDITSTTIGSGGVNFRSITSSGATSGIVLNNTGSTAGLTVHGNSGTCTSSLTCTGGAITSTTSHGISLTNTRSPSFTRMYINSTSGSGVDGTTVTNFTFQNGMIDNSGTGGGANTSNIAFNDASGSLTENNISGNVQINNNTLTNARFHGIDLTSYNGTISDLSIAGNTITSSTSAAASGGNGILIDLNGGNSNSASLTKGLISGNNIRNFPSGAGIRVDSGNASSTGPSNTLGTDNSTNRFQIVNNTVAGASSVNRFATQAINVTVSGVGSGFINIEGNGKSGTPVGNVTGVAIACSAFGRVTATCTVHDNNIAAFNSLGANTLSVGADSQFDTNDAPNLTAVITSNTITNSDGNGILAVVNNSKGTMNVKIQNNNVSAPTSAALKYGIRVESGSINGDTTLCLNISGNTAAGSGGGTGIGIRKQGTVSTTNDFGVHGWNPATVPSVGTYIANNNPGATGGVIVISGSNYVSCSNP